MSDNFKPKLTGAQAVRAGILLERSVSRSSLPLSPEEHRELQGLLALAREDAPKDDPLTPGYDESKTPEHNRQIADVAFQECCEKFQRELTKMGDSVIKTALAMIPELIAAAVKR